jgi:hypothetical protein
MSARTAADKVLSLAGAVLLAGYAGVAVVSGMDRSAMTDPAAHGLVGWPYDSFSARSRAMAALQGGQPAQAMSLSARAMLSDPVDPTVIGRYGWAQMLMRNTSGADETFRVSGGLGWRDPSTQVYWLSRSLELGDANVAAQRLDALLRQTPYFEQRDALVAAVLASEEGRQAVAQRLKEQPAWSSVFLSDTGNLPPQDLVNRADVVSRAANGAFDCLSASRFVDNLMAAGQVEPAQMVWRKVCAPGTDLVYDGHFTQLDSTARRRAFDWQLSSRGDVDILLQDRNDGSHQLGIKVSGPASQIVLRQAMVLDPGAYRLTWSMPGTSPVSAAALRVSLGCGANRVVAQPGIAQGNGRYQQVFSLAADCDVRSLVFWLSPGPMVALADIQLDRLPAGTAAPTPAMPER